MHADDSRWRGLEEGLLAERYARRKSSRAKADTNPKASPRRKSLSPDVDAKTAMKDPCASQASEAIYDESAAPGIWAKQRRAKQVERDRRARRMWEADRSKPQASRHDHTSGGPSDRTSQERKHNAESATTQSHWVRARIRIRIRIRIRVTVRSRFKTDH